MSPASRGAALPGPAEVADEGLLARVGKEIEAEVRQLRSRGVFPLSYERRLHDLFAQVVPTGVAEHETDEALRYLESVSHVDIEVPLGSRIPGGSALKHLMRPLMAWYLNYVAMQANRFMGSTVRATRLLAERVTAIEEASPSSRSWALPLAERGRGVDLEPWTELVLRRVAAGSSDSGAAGPVLHAECGTGGLVRHLVAGGIDAYGVDPCADLLDQSPVAPVVPDAAVDTGLDLRWVAVLDHLWGLEDTGLGGLVLSGCVDRLEVGAQRELAAAAAAKVGFGGVVVVIATTPGAWLARRLGLGEPGESVIEADLAPGRPLYPQTWAWLLASEGLADVEVIMGPASAGTDLVVGSGAPSVEADGARPVLGSLSAGADGAWAVSDPAESGGSRPALARLAAMISGPASFAVVATRPGAVRTPTGP